jgi:N-acetylmuramoyl-L-alanine amidase
MSVKDLVLLRLFNSHDCDVNQSRYSGQMLRFFTCLSLFLLVFLSAVHAQAAQVTDLRMGRNGASTRFVLDIDAAVPYRAFVLNNPARLVIDLPVVTWSAPMNKGDANKIVGAYRKAVYSHDTLRLVLDLKRPAIIADHTRLPPDKGRPWRYVFDLKPVDPMTFQAAINHVKVGGGAPETATKNMAEIPDEDLVSTTTTKKPTATQIAKAPSKRPLIVIDAGHGGPDPGAHAVNGEYEKNITLAVALKVKALLEQSGQYRVKLTRDRDFFIKLPDRVAIARKAGADLFVSLHADTISRPLVHGASVYTLSDKASDAESAKLAERENAVDTLVNVDVGKVDEDVANILIDLVTRDTMNQSRTLAEAVVQTFHQNGLETLEEHPHRSAGFAVLKAPDIPSILIEMGYLSNRQEAANLSNDMYRVKIAHAVAATVDHFFGNTGTASAQ